MKYEPIHAHDIDRRCRLCTANDVEGLAEQLAERMWESRRDPVMDPRSWADAGSYWQRVMRDFARESIEMLRELG